MRSTKLDAALLMNENVFLVNRGMLAEQFIGQEILAYLPRLEEGNLFFWARDKKSSMAEVDFVTAVDDKIIPIEVKAGATGHLKSIKLFMQEKNCHLGIRFSQHQLSFHDSILSLPLYMVGEVNRLIKQLK